MTDEPTIIGPPLQVVPPDQPKIDSLREQRLAILPIGRDDLLSLIRLFMQPDLPGTLGVYRRRGLPADAEIVEVRENWEYHTLDVLLRSSEFEPLQDGCMIPRICGRTERELVIVDSAFKAYPPTV